MRSLRTLLAVAALAAAAVPAVASASIDPPCRFGNAVTVQWHDGVPEIVLTPPPYAC